MSILSGAAAGLALLTASAGANSPVEAPRPAAEVVLRYQFHAGDVLRFEVDQSTQLLVTKGQTRQEQSNLSVTRTHYTVDSVDSDGSAKLIYRIDSARMQFQFDDLPPVKFDSQKEATPKIYERIRERIGVDLAKLEIGPDGRIASVTQIAARPTGTGKPAAKNVETKEVGSGGVFPVLPAEPVQVGDEWTHVSKIEVSLPETELRGLTKDVRILHSYTLESLESGEATIAYQSAPLTAAGDPQIELQVAPQKASGTIRFDVAAGRVLSRSKKVNNVTIGFQGPDSAMTTRSTRTERLLPPPREVSARE